MAGEVIGIATFIVTMITWLDELTWARDHAREVNKWLLHKLCPATGNRYQHTACRNYRVSGPGRKV